jgi:hypothetical protein
MFSHWTSAILMIMVSLIGCSTHLSQSPNKVTDSGLQRGEEVVPWNPIHVAGPNQGTNACPVCTYEGRPVVLIFTKDGPNAADLAGHLEKLVDDQQKRDLKGFVVVLDSTAQRLK